jgi:hypothetical protein
VIAAVILAAGATVFSVMSDDGREANGLPEAPWSAKALRRVEVPAPYKVAWDRARNRSTCALLFPVGDLPGLLGARTTEQPTPDDKGWDIFLSGDAGTVEVLGLFEPSTQADAPTFTRTWADGSIAKYGPDVGNALPGTYDSNSSPFEAVLTVPGQGCAYRIYDTFGKDHIELLFTRLRLMKG